MSDAGIVTIAIPLMVSDGSAVYGLPGSSLPAVSNTVSLISVITGSVTSSNLFWSAF